MGILDSLFGRRARARAERAERSGELARAVELWLEAGLGDEAARVLLLRADAARDTEARLAFCEAAAKAAASVEARRTAVGRKASLELDLLEAAVSSSRAEWERVARALEEAGLFERAAKAFARAEDGEGEVRALTQAGAIDALEARLEAEGQRDSARRDVEATLARFEDQDRSLARAAALALARAALDRPPRSDDARERAGRERLALAARTVRERLLRPPFLRARLAGAPLHLILGDEVVIGRSEGALVIPAPSLSRRHVRLFRAADGPAVEDLGSRNGTRLGGARLERALPVTGALELTLGDEVRVTLAPDPLGVRIEAAGQTFVAPLGPAPIGAWRVVDATEGGEALVRVLSEPGARPFAGGLEVGSPVELCRGDTLSAERGGAPLFEALGDEGPA